MKRFFLGVLVMVGFVFAQVDLVKQQAEINSAKADLEEVRKGRDAAIAMRWQDKERFNQEREASNQKVAEVKEKLDALAGERGRLFEELRSVRDDLVRIQEEAETKRSEFLILSAQQDRAEALARLVEQGTPFALPERIQNINRLKKEMDLFRDDPTRVASNLLLFALKEMQWTRSTSRGASDLVFPGGISVRGEKMRLGAVGAAQWEPSQNQTAIMLPSAGEKGRLFIWQDNLTQEAKAMVQKAFHGVKDSSFVWLPVDVLLSTALTSEMASQTELTFREKALKFFRDGGVLMYPIVGLFIFALLLSLERLVVLGWKGRYSRRQLKNIFAACEAGNLEEAKKLASTMKGSLGSIARAVLRTTHLDRSASEKSLEEVFAREVPQLEKRLQAISVFGASAPLLGLLGTVMGMIQLFDVITLYGTSDPKLLAGGISVALVTTEAGLMVAIPIQLIHTWLSNRVENMMSKMETSALKLLNIVWIRP